MESVRRQTLIPPSFACMANMEDRLTGQSNSTKRFQSDRVKSVRRPASARMANVDDRLTV